MCHRRTLGQGTATRRLEFSSIRRPLVGEGSPKNGMTLIVQRYDMISLRQWLCALALTGLAIVISFYWFDRRIALFVHNHFPHGTPKVAEPITYIPNPLIWIAAITFVVLGLVGLKGRSLSKMQSVLLVCSVSLMVAEAMKNE